MSFGDRERLSFVRKNPAFGVLQFQTQLELARSLVEHTFRPDEIVIAEGAEADRLYLIAEGKAEVAAGTPNGNVMLGVLGPGEMFGEIALLTIGARRTATVKAITALRTFSLDGTFFTKLLRTYPDMKALFEKSAELLRIAAFLKQASPFTALNPEKIKELAKRLKKSSFAEQVRIIRQGEEGDSCYLIRQGRVEVVIDEGEKGEKVVATLEAGSIFGEAALLTSNPRNASVRTIEPCEFLELDRSDLIEVMGIDSKVGGRMMELLSLRGRPCCIDGVTVSHKKTTENMVITILNDPKRHAYFQLSPEGWFIWQKLDGRRNLRELALDYLATFNSFAPHMIAETIARLASAGFLVEKRISSDVQDIVGRISLWRRLMAAVQKIAEYRVVWKDVDGIFTAFYQTGVRFLYTLPAQIILAALAAMGGIVFTIKRGEVSYVISDLSGQPVLILLLIAGLIFAIFAHELGHAFTVKAFGRKVWGVGVGWYWFGPVAFVDTSDMWMAGRWQRIAVTISGPYTNIILAGLASFAAWLIPYPLFQKALWLFAAGSYLIVFVNLNPLLEYDGYYVLMDIIERPNLRARSLSWLKNELPKVIRSPKMFRGHLFELFYGIGSLLYVAVMIAFAILFFRLILQKWIA